MTRTARLVPVLLLAAACASGGDDRPDGRGDGGGGTSGTGARWTSSSRVAAPAGAPTLQTFPVETQAFMKEGLRQFSKQDPRWDATRREWLALGERESEFLVQTLWASLLAAQDRNAPDLVERARHELAIIGPPSVPLMASVLSAAVMATPRNEKTGEAVPVSVDDLQRGEAAQVLSIIGAPAVPALLRVLEDGDAKGGRRAALAALGNMGERGGDAGARALITWARDSDESLRVAAVHGMRTCRDAATQAALVDALGDGDQLVREKAADAIAARGDRSMVPVLRSAAERARGEGRIGEAGRMNRAADVLEKRGR